MRKKHHDHADSPYLIERRIIREEEPTTTVTHNGKRCPWFKRSEYVEPRVYPTDHKLWDDFVAWVKSGQVVRSDLLEMRDMDWEIIWKTYIARYES